MSVLPTAGEVREPQYEAPGITSFGGVNTDVSDLARPAGEAKEIHNMRHGMVGTLVTRTGIKVFDFRDKVVTVDEVGPHETDAGTIHPIGNKTEYAVWHADGTGKQAEYRYDVALIWEEDAQRVMVYLLDKAKDDGTHLLIRIPGTYTSEPSGCIMQHGAYLVVSLFDFGTWIAWPKQYGTPATAFPIAQWNVEGLGKDVCPTPGKVDFPKTLKGDLLVFSAHDGPSAKYWMEYDKVSASDPTKVILRLPLEADYRRSDTADIVATQLIPRWKIAKIDAGVTPNLAAADHAISAIDHFQHRGYLYQFIAVRTTQDAEGNPVKLRTNPSPSIFVPATNYSPFFWRNDAVTHAFPYAVTGSDSSSWKNTIPGDTVWQPIPNLAAMIELQTKYRTYFNDMNSTTDANGTGGALHWVAHWLRWNHKGNTTFFNNQPPYQCDVSAEELTGSPQAIFAWADFAGLPADAEEIEVYRTAYADVDPEKRPVSTPLFKPHVFGLVGVIAKDGTFTDTTKIPDFGSTPSSFAGYLRGQFSGDVERAFGQSPALVLGNVRTDYALLTPPKLMQAFLFESSSGGQVLKNDLTTISADGYPKRAYWYAFEDRNGFRSAGTLIAVDTTSTTGSAVGFTFPYGYARSVVKIVLYVGVYNGVSRDYYEIARIDPEPGTYVEFNIIAYPATTAARVLSGDTPKFYEPGAVIYSNPHAPWDWPQNQIEIHHASAPVRTLEVLMGELAIVTDESFTLTQLRKPSAPRSEEDTAWIGCPPKNGWAKVLDAEVIFSQHGLYFLVPNRPEPLPWKAQGELRFYLEEKIPGLPALANIRRASMGYHDRHKELWVHIPSSIDLWPKVAGLDNTLVPDYAHALPHRTFIIQFLGSVAKIVNYTFDISPDFEIKNALPPAGTVAAGPPAVDRSTWSSKRVLFASGLDGTLYASYTGPGGGLRTINCDDGTVDFQSPAYATFALGMERVSGQKQLNKTELRMTVRGKVQVITGFSKKPSAALLNVAPRLRGAFYEMWDALRGHIHDRAEVYTMRRVYTDMERSYFHPAIDRALETKGTNLMLRIRTEPDANQRHRVELQGLALYLDQKHNHGA